MKVWIVIWVVMLHTAVDGWWYFGGTCCLHFQGWSKDGSSSFLCNIRNHSQQWNVEGVGAPEVAYSITNISLWNLCTYFQTLLYWNKRGCFSCWFRSFFWFLVLCSVFELKQCQHQVWSRPSQIRCGSGSESGVSAQTRIGANPGWDELYTTRCWYTSIVSIDKPLRYLCGITIFILEEPNDIGLLDSDSWVKCDSYIAFKLYVYNEIWTDCKLGTKLNFYMM